jgi:WD40 repeat protein
MTGCPAREQLTLLLAERLSGPEAEQVETHVQNCARCQEALDDLAGAGPESVTPRPHRDEPRPEFLHRLRQLDLAGEDVTNQDHDGSQPPPGPVDSPNDVKVKDWPQVTGYEILAEVGRGGMGVVYKARQLTLRRIVALKMILAGAHASADELARFRAEAETIARLQHPHIVQVYEVGEEKGCPYLALEYVEGGSLQEKFSDMPMAAREAAQLVETLARAIHEAHKRGVVHRDLKPANVLLTADGTPKVTDFGLAKRLDVTALQTQTGAILGTPSFMAPEQAEGKVVGPAADIHALGATLYHLLTGYPPFLAETPLDTLLRVRLDEPVPPWVLRPRLSRDLSTICLKCLRKDPGQRYASALALAEDLRRFLAGEPIQARPTSLWEQGGKWVRRRPALAAAYGLLALALVLGGLGGGATLLWRSAEAARQRAEAGEKREADLGRQLVKASNTNLYFYGLTLAERELAAHHVALAEEALGTCPAELRRWEWCYLQGRCHDDLVTFMADKAGVCSLAFSPDTGASARSARRLACGGGNIHDSNTPANVTIWDPTTGRLLLTLPVEHSGPVTSVTFSPDGKRLASASTGLDIGALFQGNLNAFKASKGEVFLWDAETGRQLARLDGCFCVAFSPDGKHLATAGYHSTVILWDAETGQQEFTFDGPAGKIENVAFSPDGTRLAAEGHNWVRDDNKQLNTQREFKVWDTATRKEKSPLPKTIGPVEGMAFSPDGDTLAVSGGKAVHLWDLATGKERRTLPGPDDELLGVQFSPDGKRLAAACLDGTVRIWDPAAGTELSTFVGHQDKVFVVAFAPLDGGKPQRLASAGKDGRVKIWDLLASNNPQSLPGHGAGIISIAVSEDGRRLASASPDDHTVIVWEPANGRPLHRLSCTAFKVAFSPDGRYLVTGEGDPTATSTPGGLTVWDVETGRAVHRLTGHTRLVIGVAFSPDGQYLVSGSADPRTKKPGEVKVWETATWKERHSEPLEKLVLGGLAFNPDGRSVALACSDKMVRLWDVPTLQPIREYRGLGWVQSVAFSQDRTRLAAGDASGLAILWNTATGEELSRLRVGGGAVTGLAFSPDGDRLVSAGFDLFGKGELNVWDWQGGREVLALPGLACAAFSSDGRRLVSAGPDHAVKIWNASAGERTSGTP